MNYPNLKPWKPGQSGNMKGRPKGKKNRNIADLVERTRASRWKAGESGNIHGRPPGKAKTMHPNSLANLRMFRKGISGNYKGCPKKEEVSYESLLHSRGWEILDDDSNIEESAPKRQTNKRPPKDTYIFHAEAVDWSKVDLTKIDWGRIDWAKVNWNALFVRKAEWAKLGWKDLKFSTR